MLLGITEWPELMSFFWLIFGASLVAFGTYFIFLPVEEVEVSPRDPREEADAHLIATLSCDDAMDIGGLGLDCPDDGSIFFC
jgi:hypothetical protein